MRWSGRETPQLVAPMSSRELSLSLMAVLLVTGLEEDSMYRISVTAFNRASASGVRYTVTAVTQEKGV